MSLVQIQYDPSFIKGGVIQWLECCLCKANVSGSTPLISTKFEVDKIKLRLMLNSLVLEDEKGRSD